MEAVIVSLDLPYGWSVRKVPDLPHPPYIELISPEGEKVVLVKDEQTGGQDIVYRYFSTLLHQSNKGT